MIKMLNRKLRHRHYLDQIQIYVIRDKAELTYKHPYYVKGRTAIDTVNNLNGKFQIPSFKSQPQFHSHMRIKAVVFLDL